MTITCLYTCQPCGLNDVEVEVPARTTEDVVYWAEQILGKAVGEDHARRSPHCTARSMTHVKVPIAPGTYDRIGRPPVN